MRMLELIQYGTQYVYDVQDESSISSVTSKKKANSFTFGAEGGLSGLVAKLSAAIGFKRQRDKTLDNVNDRNLIIKKVYNLDYAEIKNNSPVLLNCSKSSVFIYALMNYGC